MNKLKKGEVYRGKITGVLYDAVSPTEVKNRKTGKVETAAWLKLEIVQSPKNQVIDQVIDQMNEEIVQSVKNQVIDQMNEEDPPLPLGNIKRCTCGMEAIGGGVHSDWCDKAES